MAHALTWFVWAGEDHLAHVDTMNVTLQALLIPPQKERLRSVFALRDVPLQLIVSGWHRLVVAAPGRVFVFPRNQLEVPMLEREAEVLTAIELDFAPRLIGLHRDDEVSPYPFLELTRIPGESYEANQASLSFEQVAQVLESLGRRIAQCHQAAVPSTFAARPDHLDTPRVSEAWTRSDQVPATAHHAAASLRPHLDDAPADLWAEALMPIAALNHTTVHGEVSDGQFLIDERMHVTGVVDWDGLHVDHPFVDLDFGEGGHRICSWEENWTELKIRIWDAYAIERGIRVPEWRSVNLFWCLLDAMTLLGMDMDQSDPRWRRTLNDLAAATRALR